MRLRKETKRILKILGLCLFLLAVLIFGATVFRPHFKQGREYLSFDRHFAYPLDEDMVAISQRIREGGPVMVPTINEHPYNYIYNASSFCKNRRVNILILIKSRAKNYRLRHMIRHTMMKDIYGKHYDDVQIAFLLGKSQRDRFIIGNEDQVFRDIIQEDFIDSHRNDTLKVIMGYNWIVQYCKNAEYIVIMDDDVFVNIEMLNQYLFLIKAGSRNNIYSGKVISNEVPIREKNLKQSVTFEEYPFDRYPDFIDGSFILHNQECVRKFKSIFPFVKYFSPHDVYLGFVAHKMGISPLHNIFVKAERGRFFESSARALAMRLSNDAEIYYEAYVSMTGKKT